MTNEEVLKKNGEKKFDVVLQNPPYSGSTHLKFLEKTIEIADKVISVQPADWIFKDKYNNISKHIKDLEYFKGNDFRTIFGIQSNSGGIFVCDEEGGYDIEKLRQPFPIKTIREHTKTTFKDKHVDDYDGNGIFVPLKLMTSDWDKNKNYMLDKLGILQDGKTLDGTYYKEKRNKNKDRWCGGIYFNTLKEAENFVKYIESDFFVKYVNYTHISSRYILKDYPFLDDYTKEWTNEMIYNYFKLSEKEIKEIENYKITNDFIVREDFINEI